MGGWVSIPPDANQRLLHAEAEGKPRVELKFGNSTFIYDLIAKSQTNAQTGAISKLRPPMVRSSSTISTASTRSSLSSSPRGSHSMKSSIQLRPPGPLFHLPSSHRCPP